MHYIDCFFDIAFQCVTIIIHCQYLGGDLCRCGVDQKELNKWISCNTGEQVFVSCIGIFHAASFSTYTTFKESLLRTSKGYSALINGSKSILAFSANSIPSLQFYWDEKRNKSQFLLDKTRQLPRWPPKMGWSIG